jgi:FixJ family two-component response regulator
MNPALIHVIDDDDSFRAAVTRTLEQAGYRVSAYARAEEALKSLPTTERGCILLDLKMPGLSGSQFQERLNGLQCALPVVFLSAHGSIPDTVRALKAGANDFLQKPISRAALLRAIASALQDYDEIHSRKSESEAVKKRLSKLTPRESEVFRLVVRGKLNKEIAYTLGASERTIKVHRHNVMQKLEVRNFAELISIAEKFHLAP